MPVPGQLSTMLFHIGVAITAILPRLPNDPPFPFSIGGDLSYNFRKAMLCLDVSNIIRILIFEDPRFIDGTVRGTKLFFRLDAMMYHLLKAVSAILSLPAHSVYNAVSAPKPHQYISAWARFDDAGVLCLRFHHCFHHCGLYFGRGYRRYSLLVH